MTARMTSMCSSWSSVGDSPVVPTGTRPSMPPLIWYSTSFREVVIGDLRRAGRA